MPPTALRQHDFLTVNELLSMLDNVPDAIGRFDRQLRHVYVNRATAEANGIPVADFYLKTMGELGHSASIVALIESHLREVFADGQPRHVDVDFLSPHGRRFFHSLMAPERDEEGSVSHVVVISRDITEQKQAELALLDAERAAALGRIAAQLAHEINNPLQSVTNAVYLLERSETLSAADRDHLAVISAQLQRVATVANQIIAARRKR